MIFDNKFNQIRNNIINFLSVTNEEKEKSKKSIYYKIIIFLKTNKFKLGSIILILLCWYYFCNLFNENSNHKKLNIQIGGKRAFSEGVGKTKTGSYLSKVSERGQKLENILTKKNMSYSKSIGKGIRRGTGKVLGSSVRAIESAPGRMKDYTAKKAGQFKAMSGTIYKLLFQIALVVMMFIILGPTLAIGFAMIVCYALLKKKIMYVKEL